MWRKDGVKFSCMSVEAAQKQMGFAAQVDVCQGRTAKPFNV